MTQTADSITGDPIEVTAQSFAGLTLARYEIRLSAVDPARIPAFPGSTIRGAFGFALKRAVCVMSHRNCSKCLVFNRCIYPYVFETASPADSSLKSQKNAPHPFTIDPPIHRRKTVEINPSEYVEIDDDNSGDHPSSGSVTGSKWEKYRKLVPGDELTFGLMLAGRAIEFMPYIVFAVYVMAETGLGAGQGRFDLVGVEAIDPAGDRSAIYDERAQRLEVSGGVGVSGAGLNDWVDARLSQLNFCEPLESLKLHFKTPVRIKSQDQLQPRPGFEMIVRNLLRRVSLLTELYGASPLRLDYHRLIERAATVEIKTSSLRWWDIGRYSTRQHAPMKIGGFVGEIEFCGQALREFLPLLAAGELVGIGKGTSFGLGKYEIEK